MPDRITIFSVDGEPIASLEIRPDPIWKDQERVLEHQAPSGRDLYRVITRDGLGVQRLLMFPIVKGGGA